MKSKREIIFDRLMILADEDKSPFRGDPESAHQDADMLLLDLIDDEEISDAYMQIHRWYA